MTLSDYTSKITALEIVTICLAIVMFVFTWWLGR